jgi:hypothetical protein
VSVEIFHRDAGQFVCMILDRSLWRYPGQHVTCLIKVDQTFDEFLLDILGMKTMDRFRNEDKVDYFNLCREFEVKNVEFIQIARYKLPSVSVLATGFCRNISPRCWTICLHDF